MDQKAKEEVEMVERGLRVLNYCNLSCCGKEKKVSQVTAKKGKGKGKGNT